MADKGHAALLKLRAGRCLRCGNPRRSGEVWCRACADKVRQRGIDGPGLRMPTGKRAAAYLAALFDWAHSEPEEEVA